MNSYKLDNLSTLLIRSFNSLKISDEAWKQAERSPMKNFKTGAVLFNGAKIISKGCSHVPNSELSVASIHAEQHCLQNVYDFTYPADMFILSIGKAGNPAFSSKPCLSCVKKLDEDPRISMIYYLERLNDGTWIMNVKSPLQLWREAQDSVTRLDYYAKDMRI